jgi:hypothetical protein
MDTNIYVSYVCIYLNMYIFRSPRSDRSLKSVAKEGISGLFLVSHSSYFIIY